MSTPITPSTAKKLCDLLNISEEEAKLMLGLKPPTLDEQAVMTKVNLRSLSGAFSPTTTKALLADKKLELPKPAQDILDAANRVRYLNHLESTFSNAHQSIYASAKADCQTLSDCLTFVVAQIEARAMTNPELKFTYSSLLAYHHARYPGRRAKRAKVESPPAPTPEPSLEKL